jgi:hypothetical protein
MLIIITISELGKAYKKGECSEPGFMPLSKNGYCFFCNQKIGKRGGAVVKTITPPRKNSVFIECYKTGNIRFWFLVKKIRI